MFNILTTYPIEYQNFILFSEKHFEQKQSDFNFRKNHNKFVWNAVWYIKI